jgi:hypothetical protein
MEEWQTFNQPRLDARLLPFASGGCGFTCGHSRTHSVCRSQRLGAGAHSGELLRRGPLYYPYAAGQKSVLSKHPAVGNSGGKSQMRLHKGMNLLELPLELDSSPRHK